MESKEMKKKDCLKTNGISLISVMQMNLTKVKEFSKVKMQFG